MEEGEEEEFEEDEEEEEMEEDSDEARLESCRLQRVCRDIALKQFGVAHHPALPQHPHSHMEKICICGEQQTNQTRM